MLSWCPCGLMLTSGSSDPYEVRPCLVGDGSAISEIEKIK
jgi:hypothetical protein